MEVIHGSKGIPLSAIRLCRMDVTHNMALSMCRSPHLNILYLLRSELKDLEAKPQSWIGNVRG